MKVYVVDKMTSKYENVVQIMGLYRLFKGKGKEGTGNARYQWYEMVVNRYVMM
jgi:hypothetical protein